MGMILLLLCIILIWCVKECFMKYTVGPQTTQENAEEQEDIEIIADKQKTQDNEALLII